MLMETKNKIQAVQAKTRKEWRKWLEKHHQAEKSVWLIIFRKQAKTKSIYYDEAVEEALCFGWIDSKGNKRDDESYYLYFAQCKPKSNWSKINRERAGKMIKQGLMTPAGQALIDLAKKTGTWKALDVQNSVIPSDLQKLFNKNKTAFKNFQIFPPSSKKIILEWVLNAKTSETRQRRILQTVELAEKNIRANHPTHLRTDL
jgi:uncharacterized protein YdeI (YjbR/CyaY-like superfamily)